MTTKPKTKAKSKESSFVPTEMQQDYLKYLQQNDVSNLNLKEQAEEVGISYFTLINWRRSKQFKEWLEKNK